MSLDHHHYVFGIILETKLCFHYGSDHDVFLVGYEVSVEFFFVFLNTRLFLVFLKDVLEVQRFKNVFFIQFLKFEQIEVIKLNATKCSC